MSDYGFGPLSANTTTTRPVDVDPDGFAKQTWFKDATGAGKKDGTVLNASWLNHIVGNLRTAVINAGVALRNEHGADHFLYDAIVSIALKVTGFKGGSNGQVIKVVDGEYLPADNTLDSLQDVAAGNPQDGQVLRFVSGAWRSSNELDVSGFATTSYVDEQIATLRGLPPSTLDTLIELAAAIGNDPAFATTVNTAIALAQATANTANTSANSALTQIANLGPTTQPEAEAGTNNTKFNSPLRTEQQIVGKSRTFARPQRVTRTSITHNVAWDASTISAPKVNVNGSAFTIANPTGLIAEQVYSVLVEYTTAHSIAWGSAFKGMSGVTPTATAGAKDRFSFESDGTNLWLVGYRLNIGAS